MRTARRRSGCLGLLAAAFVAFSVRAATPQPFDPVGADPAPDAAHPAQIVQLSVPSHGAELYGAYYRAAGASAHATVLFLHGFPGFEQNEDLAQVARRAGFNALIFHYRGAWGSTGSYSFTHCIEDVQAVLAYLRTPAHAQRLGADPDRLVLVGHSVGGHLAGIVAAADPAVLGVAMISAANRALEMKDRGWSAQMRAHFDAQLAPLRGTSGASLARELRMHARDWDLIELAPKWQGRAVLVVSSDDAFRKEAEAIGAAAQAADPRHVTLLHLATDHSYSDARVALSRALIGWLQGLPGAQPR